jgi:hypothetical protein
VAARSGLRGGWPAGSAGRRRGRSSIRIGSSRSRPATPNAVGVAPGRRGARPDIVAEGHRPRLGLGDREYDVGELGAQGQAAFGAARLDDHWPALRSGRHGQRFGDREELPVMIGRVDQVRVGVRPAALSATIAPGSQPSQSFVTTSRNSRARR